MSGESDQEPEPLLDQGADAPERLPSPPAREGPGEGSASVGEGRAASETEFQLRILQMARCEPDTPALPHGPRHHELVRGGVEQIVVETAAIGGQLGRPSGARFRTYERLKRYAEAVRGTLMETAELARAIDDVYRYPLRSTATDTLNRQLRSGIEDAQLAELVIALRDDDRLSIVSEEEQAREPQIICSLGLYEPGIG